MVPLKTMKDVRKCDDWYDSDGNIATCCKPGWNSVLEKIMSSSLFIKWLWCRDFRVWVFIRRKNSTWILCLKLLVQTENCVPKYFNKVVESITKDDGYGYKYLQEIREINIHVHYSLRSQLNKKTNARSYLVTLQTVNSIGKACIKPVTLPCLYKGPHDTPW